MNGRRLLQLITPLVLLGCETQAGSPIEEARLTRRRCDYVARLLRDIHKPHLPGSNQGPVPIASHGARAGAGGGGAATIQGKRLTGRLPHGPGTLISAFRWVLGSSSARRTRHRDHRAPPRGPRIARTP